MGNDKMTVRVAKSVSEATVVTHPAPHHGDEVMAVVMIGLWEGVANVYRTRNNEEIDKSKEEALYVVDVGGVYDLGLYCYDHHQRDFEEAREDGVKYSSAGLVWREFGIDLCEQIGECSSEQAEKAAAMVDEVLIKGIDLADYGIKVDSQMTVSQAVSLLNPNWNEDVTDEAFIEACELARLVLVRTICSCVAAVKGQDAVDSAIDQSANGMLLLPQFITGWLERVVTSEAANELLYCVFKNLQGQWNVQALPPSLERRSEQRKPLPEAWRGLNGQKLQEVTGVSDAVFCHNGGFICGARSYEGAVELARLAIEAE